MFSYLNDIGYSASREVDDFLDMEFITTCWVCNTAMGPGMRYIMILRTQAEQAARQAGPALHMGHHVLLVDLIEPEHMDGWV